MEKTELRKMIKEEIQQLKEETIRVFKTTKLKAFDSKDIDIKDIVERSKDIKMKDSSGGYLINKVKLEDGSKWYVWSVNQKFD